MGIYSSGNIFGIMMYTFSSDADDTIITLFTKQYDIIMTDEQKKEAYLVYKEVVDKVDNISFKYYTECTSTHELQPKNYMSWYPMSLEQFLENFKM
jgi:hypothetical protein